MADQENRAFAALTWKAETKPDSYYLNWPMQNMPRNGESVRY